MTGRDGVRRGWVIRSLSSDNPLYPNYKRPGKMGKGMLQGSQVLWNVTEQMDSLEEIAGHAEPRTTGLYDRRQKKVTRNIVERISI